MRLKYKEGHIMRLDELSFEICLERRTTKGSSSGRIKRLAPVFILVSIKTANVCSVKKKGICQNKHKDVG